MALTDQENVFASYYNIGICFRVLKKYDSAIEYFQKALEWAALRKDGESECIVYGQLGVVNLLQKESKLASINFNNCLEITLQLKNQRLQLDTTLCLAYIEYN